MYIRHKNMQVEAQAQLQEASEQRALAAKALAGVEAAREAAAGAAAEALQGRQAAEAEVARLREEAEDRRVKFMQLQVCVVCSMFCGGALAVRHLVRRSLAPLSFFCTGRMVSNCCSGRFYCGSSTVSYGDDSSATRFPLYCSSTSPHTMRTAHASP